MKTILITGGSGFIGSHTCITFLENGFKIIILDSNINSSPKSISKISQIVNKNILYDDQIIFEKGDIRDQFFLNHVFQKALERNNPIEAVIHFAGLKSVAESVSKPLLYWDVNVMGSICLFKVMESFGCRTIVFSSTATIYGDAKENPITEKCIVSPKNSYGNCKLSVEYVLKNLYESPNSM